VQQNQRDPQQDSPLVLIPFQTNALQTKKRAPLARAQGFDGTELPSVICCRRSDAARSPAAAWSIGGKPSRAFLESATKPWLISLRGQGDHTMQTVVNAFAQRAAARALLLAFVVLSVAFYLAPIQVEVATLFYVGLLAPALGIAAMAGFIAWNWRVFWILLGAGFLVTAFVVVGASNGGWALPI
jgi:hypothetical protein